MSLEKGIQRFVKKWVQNMTAIVPVRTGTLKRSIKSIDRPDPIIQMKGYGQFVDSGHRALGRKGTKVPPNPQPDGFIDPSFDKTVEEMGEELPDEVFAQVTDEMDNVFKKYRIIG
tara:strand:- start:1538 stop:1882 length:345 start_codon:yes stop_codon:yes gene_type:complete